MRAFSKAMWGLLLSVVGATLSVPANAERFTWFKHHEHEGWIEDTGEVLRLRYVPYLLGPDFSHAPPAGFFNFGADPINVGEVPEYTADGRIKLPYRIVRASRLEAQTLDAISAATGISRQRLSGAAFDAVQARYRRVVLEIAGREAAVGVLGGQLVSGDTAAAFHVDQSELPNLRAGNYRIYMDYTHPIADYSALSLDMQVEQTSTAWLNAFREVVRRRSSSGGRFLFFDFSSTVSSTRVRESARAGGLEQGGTQIDIVLRDPTPDQQARVESVLGFAKLTREQMLQRHQVGMATALAAANPELAKAHELYIQAFSADPPADASKLVEALAALKGDDPISFMVAGFQMRESQQSGYYRYDYAMAVSQSSQERTRYREFLIRNSDIESRYYAYTEPGGMARALDAANWKVHRDVFGQTAGPVPTARDWTAGVRRALLAGNALWLRYALSDELRQQVPGLDPDAVIDPDGNRLLHLAARRGDATAVDALISAGAGVRRRNQAGDSAADSAADAGHLALGQRLRALEARNGRIELEFVHPQGMKLGVDIGAPSGLTGASTRLAPTRLQWRSEDSARLVRLWAQVRVEALMMQSDCARIRFPAQIMAVAGGCRVFTTAPFQRLVRYPVDGSNRYVLRVVLQDWQSGFAVVSDEN